jgi:hypothetical protein
MRIFPLLSALALACGSSSSKPAAPAAAPAPAAPPPAAQAEPTPPAKVAPEPELPPIPEAPPPAQPGAPRPHVVKAMAYLPPDTQVVIGVDVPRIAGTPLGDKLRAALVAGKLPAPCEALSAAQFGNVVIGTNGSGKVVVVIDGKLAERAAVACLEAGVKAKGAKAQTKMVAGRKVHYVTGSADDNGWLTWTKGGVVLASSEAALADALDPKTAKLAGDLAALTAQADHGRMVWAAGVVSPASLAALGAPAGSVPGPLSLRAGIDVAADTDVDVVLGGSTPAGAAAMADGLRALIAPMRSAPGTAPLFAGLRLGVHGSDVHVTARLDADITRKLIEAVNVK